MNILREIGPIKNFTRHLNYPHGDRQDEWHRVLEAEGEFYCGAFDCSGNCGLPKLVRKYAEPGLLEGEVIEQASALLGIESVWSAYRWGQSNWQGSVILVEYDESYPLWL